MNPIELEWQHIKKDELAGQMFDDELELAYAVIHGVEVRAKGEITHTSLSLTQLGNLMFCYIDSFFTAYLLTLASY
jgi:hypothetical protein